ncbi:penicillin-binding protein [Nocardioides stalactiti]|uniref:penicillin-binding protein n=1 Tax=Nocardioides stalactiti TaxID=2755356 RepID=UPI001601F409|nr:transglycosylase domain-containing protein [Nocardioides stalactiti]
MARSRTEGLSAFKVISHLGVMLVVAAVLGVVVSGLAIPFAGVLGFAARNVSESIDELPQELETELLPQRTEILDRNGDQIATIYDQNRVIVPLRQISRIMVKAIVSIEDYRFYQHGALDVKGTMRALFTNQAANGVVQGGSSITQQLVKLTLLNQADTKRERAAATDDTYARKLRELRYAIALEKKYSKDWILERYLNTAYFGDGAYGIQAAAQHYFNVNASELTLRQGATLAGIVQSPGAFDPTENPDRSRERRNVVIERMAELSVISERQAARAKERGLGLDVQKKERGCVNSTAQFFCEYVIAWLKQDPNLGDNPRERWRLIENGGLTITTSIDMRMQAAAQQSVSSHVFPKEGVIGALALVEPGTGEVKALAQSRPLGKAPGETFLNYTVPKEYGKANGFQPGSTFKTFVLAAAVNQGIPLNKTYRVPAQAFIPENEFETCDGPYQSSNIWDPANFDFEAKVVNLYTGTQGSVNTFFAELEKETGLCEPYNLARRLGIRLTDPAREMVPSFTLGIPDTSPLELAEAYASFAARGKHCDALPVTKIEDNQGNLLKQYEPKCTQELPGPVADAVNDVLEGVLQPGGFGQYLYPGQQSAGKTGTSTSNRSVWFAGYTPNLAGAAVVAGINSVGDPESLDGKTIGGVTYYSTSGSATAGPIWGDAFKAIAPFLDDELFTDPSAEDIRGVLVPVPPVAGMSVETATSTLEAAGFTVSNGGYVPSRGVDEGLVAYSYPGGGSEAGSGDTITLYISDGPPPPKKNDDRNGGRGDNGGRGNNGGRGGRGNNGRGNG